MTVQDAIQGRRSIRKYKPDAVAAEDLETILQGARLAPSGCNAQPWRFVVVTDADLRNRLAGETMTLIGNELMCRQAPVLIACLAVVDAHCEIPDRMVELSKTDPEFAAPTIAKRTGRTLKSRFDSMPPQARAAYMSLNTGIAMTHMMLQATELGYGTCWMGAFDREKAREMLSVPRGIEIVGILALGRPDEDPSPRPRVAMDQLVFADQYGQSVVD